MKQSGVCCAAALALVLGVTPAGSAEPGSSDASPAVLPIDRVFQVLPAPVDGNAGPALRSAARELGSWELELAGIRIAGPVLQAIVERGDPAWTRAAREVLGRPVDLGDLLYFLDDVLRAGRTGLRDREVVVPSGRARAAGILLHPDDVFTDRPRRYGERPTLPIDRPLPPKDYPPAEDDEPLGPRWTARFENPESEEARLAALDQARPEAGLAARIGSLLEQLRAQGADVALTSSVRRRERGYLMWGAFLLSRVGTQRDVQRTRTRLDRINREWDLGIPVRWEHPEGWQRTIEAAREMADTYQVVYATEAGARSSKHYSGVAVDFVAVRLPARLTLRAPDGVERRFDLSDPEESRDLSLSPALIEWVEAHFRLEKLRSDYPHWDDVVRP